MIRSNDIGKRVQLGYTQWSFDKDENMVYLGLLAPGITVWTDYITGIKNDELNVFVLDENNGKSFRKKIIGDLFICRVTSIHGAPTWSVQLMGVDDAYKGFNLAPKLYAFLLKRYGFVLRSGCSQSPGGRSIWNSLCRERGIKVFASDVRGNDIYDCEYDETGTVDCEVDLYEGNNKYYLYAVCSK